MALHVYESNEPIYIQISDMLLNEIQANYEQGDYLPSEQSLVERFGVNRHTIRQAVNELVQDGIVERYRGRGTVVVYAPIDYPLRKNNRSTETLTKLGQRPDNEVLKRELIPATEGIAKRLNIPTGSTVVWLETLRYAKKLPIGVSSQFLPAPYATAVFEQYQHGSLHAFLHTQFEVELQRSYSLITAVLPQEQDARLLQMSRRKPALRMKTINSNVKTGQPVEYAVARGRADALQIRIDF